MNALLSSTSLCSSVVASNMHGHLRLDDDMVGTLAPIAEQYNYYYTAMGNHKGWPTSTPERALEYREQIRRHAPNLRVNVPCQITEGHDPEEIRRGHEMGAWIASKYMPRGVTTNSDEGVRPNMIHTLYPAYEMQAELGMPALFHGMCPHDPIGREIGWFEQEKRFIDKIGDILVRFPKLKVVFEHISTGDAVSFVLWCQAHGYAVEATVGPQYLLHNHNWLFEGGVNPGRYSIPPLQGPEHQERLIEFVVTGHGFRGNDSAPHDEQSKRQYCGCPGGIYSDAFGLDLLAYFMVFNRHKALHHFEDFVALRGPAFYGLEPPPSEQRLHIVEETFHVPESITYGKGGKIIPLFAGETLPYKVIVR